MSWKVHLRLVNILNCLIAVERESYRFGSLWQQWAVLVFFCYLLFAFQWQCLSIFKDLQIKIQLYHYPLWLPPFNSSCVIYSPAPALPQIYGLSLFLLHTHTCITYKQKSLSSFRVTLCIWYQGWPIDTGYPESPSLRKAVFPHLSLP